MEKSCWLGREKGKAGRPVVQAAVAMSRSNGDEVAGGGLCNVRMREWLGREGTPDFSLFCSFFFGSFRVLSRVP